MLNQLVEVNLMGRIFFHNAFILKNNFSFLMAMYLCIVAILQISMPPGMMTIASPRKLIEHRTA